MLFVCQSTKKKIPFTFFLVEDQVDSPNYMLISI